MPSATGTSGSGEERAAMTRLMERLMQVFPDVPRDQIAQAVEGRYHAFDSSPVRDFLPVLVERAVRQELQGAGSRHGA